MKFSISSFIISSLTVATHLAAPALASDGSTQQPFKVVIDPNQSVFSSCAEGSLQAQVLTRGGKPVANKSVTLYITAAACSDGRKATTITKLSRTGKGGMASFDFSLTDQQKHRLALRDVKCSVAVQNRFVRGGKQVVPCPKSVQVCEPQPECSQEPAICQGDMEYESMCEALASGQTENDCVTDEYDPECARIAGYVKCVGLMGEVWFENYCIARSYYYSNNMCEYVDDSQVPDCAKSGEVTCEGRGTYPNKCFASSLGIDEASCTTN